jgi:hypothetical protein
MDSLTVGYQNDRGRANEIARTIADRIPGARFLEHPDGGHAGIGYHDETYAEIADFLDKHYSNDGLKEKVEDVASLLK